MVDFTDHDKVLKELRTAQGDNHDLRNNGREADAFINKRDGQWEDQVARTFATFEKPRYTIDLTTNIVNQITGKISEADFVGKILPASGDATTGVAEILEGMVRNIQSFSNASDTYNKSARGMAIKGIDGWRLDHKFLNDNSFDQDLVIENIENFNDRVWFMSGTQKQDGSDARACWIISGLTKDDYDDLFPDGSRQGITMDEEFVLYTHKPDLIHIADFYYLEPETVELVLMDNGRVYEVDEDFEKVVDDLKDQGINELRRRDREIDRCFVRKMDNGGWLTEPKQTVFDFIPVVPVYGNYSISEDKQIYYGAVEKRMDPQRILNYSFSEEVTQVALSPRPKILMTPEQASGHEKSYEEMNKSNTTVEYYNHVPGHAPPGNFGGADVNPGLLSTRQFSSESITNTAGLFAANLGDNPGLQSGVAIKSLQTKGDVGTIEYFKSMEIAICRSMDMLVRTIPKVHNGERQVRVLGEDLESARFVELNQQVFDQETQSMVTLNDLSVGQYDVTCTVSPNFQNKQQETIESMIEVARVSPEILQMGADKFYASFNNPGFRDIADRFRAQLFQQGAIPFDQMTEKEQAQAQQAQEQAALQAQQPTPEELIGQAELMKAQTASEKNQADVQLSLLDKQLKQQENQRKAQESSAKILLDQEKQDLMEEKSAIEIALQQQDQQARLQDLRFNRILETQNAVVERLNVQADTLNKIVNAWAQSNVQGPGVINNIVEQSREVSRAQDETPGNTPPLVNDPIRGNTNDRNNQ